MTWSKHFDQLAIALSALCIAHCVAVPVLVAVLPVLAISFGTDAHFHAWMLWLVVPTSVVGFGLGLRIHGRAPIVLFGGLGMLALVVTALWGHAHWPLPLEALASVASSLVLGGAHWFNFREVRRLHHAS